MDKETADVTRDAEALKRLVKSDEWQVAKSLLVSKLASIKYIDQLDLSSAPEDVKSQAIGRKIAYETLISWFNEIYAQIEIPEHVEGLDEPWIYRSE